MDDSGSQNRNITILIVAISSVVLILAGFIGFKLSQREVTNETISPASTSITSKFSNLLKSEVSIPQEILDNKFGFPTGSPRDADIYAQYGIGWVRPHPGPFQLGLMQQDSNSPIDFSTTDEYVLGYQKERMGTLVTLWPFAAWDQEARVDYTRCLVGENDIFAPPTPKFDEKFGEKDLKPENGKKDEPIFLPRARCNPNDWDTYLAWVGAVVERYDGDGVDDVPGLRIPVKYWEVLNEPDLNADHLDFYQGTSTEYAELLIRTSKAIKEADPEAKVLIAGAAGGNNGFLNFYRGVFANKETHEAFDIGNVHCISNDDFESYNVSPYQKMLAEFEIEVPVWVTEAESLISKDVDINASQVYESTKNALDLGATKIFFTGQKFIVGDDKMYLPEHNKTISDFEVKLDGNDPLSVFQFITNNM